MKSQNHETVRESEVVSERFVIDGYARRIGVHRHRPLNAGAGRAAILYFHGGGFIEGDADDDMQLISWLAQKVPATIFSVGYSLAPEYPFPAALEDGYLALKWVAGHETAAGAIGLVGYDAGGNIAHGVATVARDRGEIQVAAQALLAPLLDPSLTHVTFATEQDVERAAQYSGSYRAYLPKPLERCHPYAAPLECSRMTGLPATLIASSECDCVAPEARLLAKALSHAGVPTEYAVVPLVPHDALGSDPFIIDEVAQFLRRQLMGATARPPRTNGKPG